MSSDESDGHMDSGIEIDGERYEVPRMDSFDMDEAQLLYDISGVVIEDFAPAHPDASEEDKALIVRQQLARIRNPAFKRGLVHIAYRRKHSDLDFFAISERVGKINALDVSLEVLRGDDEVDPSMSSPSEPEQKSSGSDTSSSSSSGRSSANDSERLVLIPGRTGTGESGTSSPESLPSASAS